MNSISLPLSHPLGLFRAAVPSGASTGIYEANELRDSGKDYHGKSVTKAVGNINKIIAPALIKKNYCVTEQAAIDNFMVKELDGTVNKSQWEREQCILYAFGLTNPMQRWVQKQKKWPTVTHLVLQ